jgi:hypothetical protein
VAAARAAAGVTVRLAGIDVGQERPDSLMPAADQECYDLPTSKHRTAQASRGALRSQDLAMDRDTKERIRAAMEADFLPEPSPDTLSQVDRRMANAAEYIAYHLGQIDTKLDRLIVLLEGAASARKEPPPR